MLNAQPLGSSTVCFNNTGAAGTLLPADIDGANAPPAGEPNFYISRTGTALQLFKFHVDFANPANTTFAGPTKIPVAAFTSLGSVPQLGTTQTLDSLSDRLMFRLAYRNFGDHETLVVTHSVTAGSSGGVRWYEIRDPNGTPVLFQQGTFAPDSNFRWMGSVATDRVGDIAVGYSESSSAMNPAIAITARTPADPLGMLQAEDLVFQGAGSQTATLSRWGDYSAMTVDPVDDCTFFFTTEYIPSNGTFNWHTRIVSFRVNNCKLDTSTAISSSLNPSNSGQAVTFTATVTENAPGSGTPTGTVTFLDGASTVGSGTLDGTGHATFATSILGAGTHAITAQYGGSNDFNGSTSSPLTQTVNSVTGTDLAVVLAHEPRISAFGGRLTFTATVVNLGSTPATNVALTEQLTGKFRVLGTPTLSAGGPCTVSGSISCPLGTVSNGSPVTLTITLVPLPLSPALSATATVTPTDANPDNNSAADTATVKFKPFVN
jgi:uncharacterized repeat protein (TIGR01451 family)